MEALSVSKGIHPFLSPGCPLLSPPPPSPRLPQQEDYDRLRPLSYPGTDVFFLAYSIASRSSFLNLDRWRAEITHHSCVLAFRIVSPHLFLRTRLSWRLTGPAIHRPSSRVMLVGLKLDLAPARREVQTLEGQDYARKYGWGFRECSSLSRQNLQATFDEIIRMAVIPQAGKMARRRAGRHRRQRKQRKRRQQQQETAVADSAKDETVIQMEEKGLGEGDRGEAGEEEEEEGEGEGREQEEEEEEDTGQHTDSVWTLETSPDGRRMYSGSRDATVREWSVADGRCTRIFKGHQDQVYHVRVVGSRLVTCSSDGTLRLWDAGSGHPLHVAHHDAEVNTFHLAGLVTGSTESVRIYSASNDKTIAVWLLGGGSELVRANHFTGESSRWHPLLHPHILQPPTPFPLLFFYSRKHVWDQLSARV